jgi:GT2 family glycosyltransferase
MNGLEPEGRSPEGKVGDDSADHRSRESIELFVGIPVRCRIRLGDTVFTVVSPSGSMYYRRPLIRLRNLQKFAGEWPREIAPCAHSPWTRLERASIAAMETSDPQSRKAKERHEDVIRELAHRLVRSREESRAEIRRLTARVAELKGSWSYRLSAPIRLVERLVASLRKRLAPDALAKFIDRSGDTAPIHSPSSLSLAESYQTWLRAYDQLDERDFKMMEDDIRGFARRPLFSAAIMAGAFAGEDDLGVSIKSLCDQVYPDVEILVCGRDREAPSNIADSVAPRVEFVTTPKGASAQAMFNQLLHRAAGEFFVLIDAGDVLSPYAIYLAARAAIDTLAPRVIYGDEDELDGNRKRCNPFFKPSWNCELALAFNYLGIAVVYQTETLRKLGGARIDAADAWRWDLMLRATNALPVREIHRLPFVLCHRGTRSSERRRNEAMAGSGVVAQELARRSDGAKIVPSQSGYLVITRRPPDDAPHVTVIVATRDRCDLLRRCVAGILHRTLYPRYDVIIVDNDSREAATLEYFRQLRCDSRVKIVSFPGPFNFSAINNMAADLAHGEILALLNNDIDVIAPRWLGEMVGHAVKPDIGIVGAKLYYPDDTVQHAGIVTGLSGSAGHFFRGLLRSDPGPLGLAMVSQDATAVTGACMLIRRRVYREAGGMDEALAVQFNDIDLCLKIRDRGLRVVWTPHAELYHLESASRGQPVDNDCSRAENDRFLARWRGFVDDDPLFNPNLSLSDPYRAPAFPPRVRRPWERSA